MLNIPMPGNSGDAMLKGYDTMSTQMARLLQAKLQREQMAQQQNQFGQSFGLQQAQENRLAALSPYQQRLLMAQASSAEQEAQQLAQQRQFMQSILGNQMPGVMSNPTAMANPRGGEASQGSAPDYGNMMDNPMLAGFFKKITGIDPYNESPNSKSQREFQDFTRKEQYKLEQPQDIPTTTTTTKNQALIQDANKLLPALKQLKAGKTPKTSFLGTSENATYNARVDKLADVYMKVMGWPNTDKSRTDAKHLFTRKTFESKENYDKRIDEIIEEVEFEKHQAVDTVKNRRVRPIENGAQPMVKFNPVTGKFE